MDIHSIWICIPECKIQFNRFSGQGKNREKKMKVLRLYLNYIGGITHELTILVCQRESDKWFSKNKMG